MNDSSATLNCCLPDGYSIDGFIDDGGQGAVYHGSYQGKEVAIKVYDPASTEPERVAREIEFLRNTNHPNLVKVVAADRIHLSGSPCDIVAYEFISGGNLLSILDKQSGHVDPNEVYRVGFDIGSALELMWKNRIVHRDVKPNNIVYSPERGYVLIDVCFARHLDRTTLTVPGGVLGTPGYKSPEQEKGRKRLTIHSDIFSLGITLYEFATHVHPFERSQRIIMQYHDGQYNYAPIMKYRDDLDDRCISAINEMLRPISYGRLATISDVFSDLVRS